MHRLRPSEVEQFFQFLDRDPRFNEALRIFVRKWEVLLGKLPYLSADATVEFPTLKCIHCDEPIAFRDEGEKGEYLWLHQGSKPSVGIRPVTYCPFPYLVVEKILGLHPDWVRRLRSSCSVCNEEVTFPTSHPCLVPNWLTWSP